MDAPTVRLVDLEVIKRFSLAVRAESAPAADVLAALDASREAVLRVLAPEPEPVTAAATKRAPAEKTASAVAKRTASGTTKKTAASKTSARKTSAGKKSATKTGVAKRAPAAKRT